MNPQRKVYVLHDIANNLYKIGSSTKPQRRCKALEWHFGTDINWIAAVDGDFQAEREIQLQIADSLVGEWSRGREWFRATPEVLAVVAQVQAHETESDAHSRRQFMARWENWRKRRNRLRAIRQEEAA